MTDLSYEFRFLIACCQVQPDIEKIASHIKKLEIGNWEEILSLSMRHGVLPLVYKALQSLSADHDLLPPQTLAAFKEPYLSIAQRNMLMTAELIRIVKLFEENGIEALAFKGPVLAQIAYGDITLRRFGDLDLFLKRQDFRIAAQILASRGYEPYFPIHLYPGDKTLFELNNDCPFYDRKRGLAVELHWDFFKKLHLPTDALEPWERTRTVTINRTPIPTLKNETHFLYHSLHGSKHLWEQMLWVVDIDRFIRNVPDLDWEEILDRAKGIGALRMFLLGPALARRHFHTPLPGKVIEQIKNAGLVPFILSVEKAWSDPNPEPEESLGKLRQIVAMRDTLLHQSLTLLEFLFKPGINERRMIVLPDSLAWAYWLLRPVGTLYRFLFCRTFKLCGKPVSP